MLGRLKNNNRKWLDNLNFEVGFLSLANLGTKASDPTEELSEYEDLINDIVKTVKEELALVTRGLILYGSYGKIRRTPSYAKYFLPGESDLDLVLVIDTERSNEAEPFRSFQKVVEALNMILFEPIYASILDLEIVEAQVDMPPPLGASFGLIQMKAAKESGEFLIGKPTIFQSIDFSPPRIFNACRNQAHRTFSDLKNAFLHHDMYRTTELFWLGVDSVLDAAHTLSTFLMTKNPELTQGMTLQDRSLCKMEVALFLQKTDLPKEMKETVLFANSYRLQGGPSSGYLEFFTRSLRFCRRTNEVIKAECECDDFS